MQEWFTDIDNDLEIDTNKNMGFVKIAFHYAFLFLKNGVSYEEGIKRILKKGGDTDTNAAIVGGLLGALHGF